MSKTKWNTIHIKVPDEMVYIGKNGKIMIKPPLTKTGKISRLNKQPSIQLEATNIQEPQIVLKGDHQNIEDVTIRHTKSDKLPNKKRGLSKAEFLEKVRSKLTYKKKEDGENNKTMKQDVNTIKKRIKLKRAPDITDIIEKAKNYKPYEVSSL